MTSDHPNHRWWTLFAMCFALFMIMLDNTVVNVALPKIQSGLHITTSESLEWTVNAYVLSFASLILLGGKLGDRFGRKRIFLVGLAVFTVASAACALSTTDTQLIVARTLQGVGAAMLNPLSLSIIVAAFPRKQLPTAIGVWAGISGLGLAVGPLLGGFLVEHVGWASVFWINVPIGFAAAAATMWAVVESRDPNARSLDVVGAVLITAGMFSGVWGLIKTNTHPWTSLYTIGFLAVGVVLIALFLLWESRRDDPMVPLSFFRNRVFAVANTVVMLVGFGMFGVIYFITLFFQNVQGYTPLQAGVRSLPMTMMVLFVAPLGGRLNTRVGPRPLMTAGMLMTSAALLGLSRLEVGSSYNLIWPFYMMMGVGIALTMPSVSSSGMGAVDPTKSGVASGVINSSRQVGGALGIAVLGSVGATLAVNSWRDWIAALPAAVQGRLSSLDQAVQGGQGALIGSHAGAAARDAALASFVHGVQGAMLVGAGLTLVAAVVSFFGLRGTHPAAAHGAAADPGPLDEAREPGAPAAELGGVG